ncbi:hypothetical protein BKA64DRAFT_681401 [Cadophora sp. MPI-SDFR-AT-0126]|nr:hypothetical protein BKA64DRAFT_681401 [Leotiomycetes sp. MPI-SDFR-AT-0126]
MSPAVQDVKRTRGRPKGAKDRVARKSGLSNNDDTRESPSKSSSSTPAPPSKRRASSSAETPQSNSFTPINHGDRTTSRSGRSLSKTRKFAHEASEPESLGPALKKRVSARSTSQASTTISTRKRLPDHGSQPTTVAPPTSQGALSTTPTFGVNGYKSLYGQSPYGTPATNGAGKYPHGREINFPLEIKQEPPINTIQPAPGSMLAPRKSLPTKRTALPEQRAAPAPSLPVILRPISEVLDTYQGLYDALQKHFKAFERYTWNVKIRHLTRSVFTKLAAMRSRRARLAFMLKEIKNLKSAGTLAVELDGTVAWPPLWDEYPTWYIELPNTPALRAELLQRINGLTFRLTSELGNFERAKILGQNLRREQTTATVDEMKWMDIHGQIKEFESMLERLGGIDLRPQLTGSSGN